MRKQKRRNNNSSSSRSSSSSGSRRLDAIQLTQGETEKYKMPQPWAQAAMSCCVYAVGMQYFIIYTVWRLSG